MSAIVEHGLARERLLQVFGGAGRLRFVRTAGDVITAAVEGRVGFVVLETSPTRLAGTLAILAAVRERCPGLPVVCYWTAVGARAADILALAHAGASGIVTLGVDDTPHELRVLGASAERRHLTDRVLQRAQESGVGPGALDILRTMLLHAHRPLPIDEVAQALGITRRTLLARLVRSGLPAPSRLASWCRVLMAAHVLARSGRAVQRVAAELDFASANALRNLVQRHAGVAPRALRCPEQFERLLQAFLAALRPASVAFAAAVPAGAPAPPAPPRPTRRAAGPRALGARSLRSVA